MSHATKVANPFPVRAPTQVIGSTLSQDAYGQQSIHVSLSLTPFLPRSRDQWKKYPHSSGEDFKKEKAECSGVKPLLCPECTPTPPAVYVCILTARLLTRPGGESYSLQRRFATSPMASFLLGRLQGSDSPSLLWILYPEMSPIACGPTQGQGYLRPRILCL